MSKNVHDLKIKVKEGTLNLSVDAMKWAYQGKKKPWCLVAS